MAVVKCPSCGKYVDSSFGNCLGCGAQVLPSGVSPSKTSPSSSASKAPDGSGGAASQFIAGLVVIAILWGGYSLLIGNGPSPEEVARSAAEDAENKRKGFHCLSAWNGSHRSVVSQVEQRLRDPSSFEHVETRITPVDENGEHLLIMEYRAANGFGGLTLGAATATIRNANCSATNTAVE